jgi:hypothetical protein
MANVAQMEKVFMEVLDRYVSAESVRNQRFGGNFIENEKAIKQIAKGYKTRFDAAKQANDVAAMQDVFDELLNRFEGSDHIRNYAMSRRFVEDEKITKDTVKMYSKQFADAVAAS